MPDNFSAIGQHPEQKDLVPLSMGQSLRLFD